MKRLERDQQDLDSQLDAQRALAGDCDKEMKELKVLLYGKFGRSINLDE
jgi:prefoldin subunit 4